MKSVDEYIASAPEETQGKLKELRKTILETVPEAEESISYGLSAYKYKGKPLIYFGIWKKHIGIYALPANIDEYKEELKKYVTSKGAIQIPLDEKLPIPMIKKLIKAQQKKIEAKKK